MARYCGVFHGAHVGTVSVGVGSKFLAQHRAEQLVGGIPDVLAVDTELHFGRAIAALLFHGGAQISTTQIKAPRYAAGQTALNEGEGLGGWGPSEQSTARVEIRSNQALLVIDRQRVVERTG